MAGAAPRPRNVCKSLRAPSFMDESTLFARSPAMFFLPVAFIVIVCAAIWYGNAQAKKCTRELDALAQILQFTFEPGPFTPGIGPFSGAGSFAVFHQGYSSASSSNGVSTHRFTAALFSKSAPPSVPNMQLYPESIFSKLARCSEGKTSTPPSTRSFPGASYSSPTTSRRCARCSTSPRRHSSRRTPASPSTRKGRT